MSTENPELTQEPAAAVTEAAQPESTPVEEPVGKPAKKERRKPHIALRISLQILSLLLALVLFVGLIAGVLLADLRQTFSAGGIKQLINTIFTFAPTASHAEPAAAQSQGYSLSKLSSSDTAENGTSDGNIDLDLDEIPQDILTGGGTEENINSLVDWMYDQFVSESEEAPITKEQLQSFVEKSTVSDYLAEELAAFADDFINGTENAQITTDELMGLLEENEELLKSELQIELDPETKEQLNQTVQKLVEESGINTTLRETVYNAVDSALESGTDLSREDIQQTLQLLTSGGLFWGVAGGCLVLILLLCLLNYYNVPAGLTWASIPCIIAGVLMSAPLLILQLAPDLIAGLIPDAAVLNMISSFAGIFAPIHYGLLGLGFALLIASIVWRIVRSSLQKKQLAAETAG